MSRHKGAFVYTGSGRKQPDSAPLEQKQCVEDAVSIQRCLARNNHKQNRCEEQIQAWKKCCDRAKEAAAGRDEQRAGGS